MQFETEVRALNGHHVVTPRGEIDLATSGQFKSTLDELVVAGHVHLVVDLSEVAFLDSTGLGALIGARRKTHAFKGSFSIVCADEQLLRVFEITGLDKVFAMHTTLDDAVPASESVS